jgi:chemotaxis protein methyltransferase CheR
MADRDLLLFTQYIAAVCGVRLDSSKRYLLESRLGEVLHATGCPSYGELYTRARSGTDRTLERKIIDAVTTNETFFFRDPKVFDVLRSKLIPELLGDDPARPLAIWSAAASTGQEAYTIAIVLEQLLFDLSKTRVRITGTDISEAAVNVANRCEYSPLEVGRGLDARLLGKYFVSAGKNYKVRDDLRSICRFHVDNLLAPKTQGPFDLIFCRNVLIYFAPADKAKVVENLLGRLKKTGMLLLGGTESLLGVTDRVRRVEAGGVGYYVRKS